MQGPYLAYASDWSVTTGKLKLRTGIDYKDTIRINPARFPNDTIIEWQWPDRLSPTGVYGYNHLAFGSFSGGEPPKHIPPSRIDRIKHLSTRFIVDPAEKSGDYNILIETFLTKQPGPKQPRALEVGFLPHASKQARVFFHHARQIGEWTDPDGRRWQVARAGDYMMLLPSDADLFVGTAHFGAAFAWLTRKGELSGTAWFNGLALGVEPVTGGGSIHVRSWVIAYRR